MIRVRLGHFAGLSVLGVVLAIFPRAAIGAEVPLLAGQVIISPPDANCLSGDFGERARTSVKGRLLDKRMVLPQGERRAVQVSCDLLGLPAALSTQVCQQARDANGQRASPGDRPDYAIAIHGGAGSAPATDTWKKNREMVLNDALTTGTGILKDGGTSLAAVEAVIRILEDSPYFNAGKGAVFNAVETHELDASIMNGQTLACGAVGGVRTIRNPISLARHVMTDTRHILLIADGAEQFARSTLTDSEIEFVPNQYFSTEHQREKLRRTQKKQQIQDADSMGTVGCVALDQAGNLAAGTSTGGLTNKKFGRLGDSPIIGAGTFADNDTCAVSGTGVGEDFIRNAVAFNVSARMRYRRDSLQQAMHVVLNDPKHVVRGGLIGVTCNGDISMQYNTAGMARAAADSRGRWQVHVSR